VLCEGVDRSNRADVWHECDHHRDIFLVDDATSPRVFVLWVPWRRFAWYITTASCSSCLLIDGAKSAGSTLYVPTLFPFRSCMVNFGMPELPKTSSQRGTSPEALQHNGYYFTLFVFLTVTKPPLGPGTDPAMRIRFRSGSTLTTRWLRTVVRALPYCPGMRTPLNSRLG
jgi:hypothetical protein